MTVTIGARHGDDASRRSRERFTPSSQALGTVEPCVIDASVMLGWDDRLRRSLEPSARAAPLGAAALATSVAGIWIFGHVTGRAIHDATAGSR
jgi:hypothetical protein